jgi:hypothetical protein
MNRATVSANVAIPDYRITADNMSHEFNIRFSSACLNTPLMLLFMIFTSIVHSLAGSCLGSFSRLEARP